MMAGAHPLPRMDKLALARRIVREIAARIGADVSLANDHRQGAAASSKNRANARRVLNVGGNSKAIAIPEVTTMAGNTFSWISTRRSSPTSCATRVSLHRCEPAAFDAIYCSHNLEHYYAHDVPQGACRIPARPAR